MEFFSVLTPGVTLRDTTLISIAKELEPLLVVFQDDSGVYQFEKIADALQMQF